MIDFRVKFLSILLSITCAFVQGASTVTASKDYVERKTVVNPVTNAYIVVGYTVGTNTNTVFASTNYVDYKVMNVRSDLITDGTNTIDAAGCVWKVSFSLSPWSFSGAGVANYSNLSVVTNEDIYVLMDNDSFVDYGSEFGLDLLEVHFANAAVVATRTLIPSSTNLVGRVALTNDIPSVVDADLTPATNYTDAVAEEFEIGQRIPLYANNSVQADYATELYDETSTATYNATDLIRESTNAATWAASAKVSTNALANKPAYDFSKNYDIIRATADIVQLLGGTVTNNPTANQGGN